MDTFFQSISLLGFSLNSFRFKCKIYFLKTTSSGRPTFRDKYGILGGLYSARFNFQNKIAIASLFKGVAGSGRGLVCQNLR